jgi:hypothetical protein
MNQSGVSVPEPIIVGVAAVTLIEDAMDTSLTLKFVRWCPRGDSNTRHAV